MATGPSNERRGYRRIAELGRGGMATVHLAAMQGSHRVTKLVVVKELRPELAVNDEFVVMFFDEARLAARLNHPNIVQSYEVGEEDGRQFIVMEYLEGQPLHRVWNKLQAAGKMSLALNLQVVHDVLAGLDYAHELTEFNGTHLKIVHRDISPHNVFVTYTGDVKVVDFGIAKAADSSTQTRVGTLKGKLTYMPPEQAMGEPVDRRADLFAVGVLLWESAAGRRLWQGMNDGAIMRGGFKIMPERVADALREHRAVRDAAVVGLPDARLGAVPAAMVELHDGGETDEAALLAHLRQRLPSTHIPVRIAVADELPRTPSLKVSLAAVRAAMIETA